MCVFHIETDNAMKFSTSLLAAALLAATAVPAAHAADDNWVVRFGASGVVPKSDNGDLAGMQANVSGDLKPTASLEYLFTRNWGLELLAAVPFQHNVRLNGVEAAKTRELPPILGVNYHFMPDSVVSPFVGAGVNYTLFYDTHGVGPLQDARVKIDNSWGAAAHAGFDYNFAPNWMFTADVRWVDIASDVHVNGSNVGHATINPLVYGLSFGYRF
jgi:outer membrane protein